MAETDPRDGDAPVPDAEDQRIARTRAAISDVDQGWHMLSSMVSGPLAWGLIGWLLDRWLGTDPWLLVGGVVLGAVLGFYLVIKRSEAAHTPRQRRTTTGPPTGSPTREQGSAP